MQTIYIETSIVSYLANRPSRDVLVAACQEATRTWWDRYRNQFELFTSALVVSEAGSGDPEAARARLVYLRDLPELHATVEVRQLARALIEKSALPLKAEADALHIALAAVHRIDLLLTWNCRHIDNPVAKPMIRSVCAANGHPCPETCTPLEILEALDHEE